MKKLQKAISQTLGYQKTDFAAMTKAANKAFNNVKNNIRDERKNII